MKNNNRIIAFVVVLTLLVSLTGCTAVVPEQDKFVTTFFDGVSDENHTDIEVSKKPISDGDELYDEDLSYVLIYNPQIYDEQKKNSSSNLKTGDFGSQIEVGLYRGDSLQEESKYTYTTPDDFIDDFDYSGINSDQNRAPGLEAIYKKGDKKDFYCFDSSSSMNRIVETFECKYDGDYCYVWTCDTSLSIDLINKYGEEFDKNIYEELVDTFGQPRFTEDSGKVHLLYYPMTDGLLGVFFTLDIFSSSEMDERTRKEYGANTDHAIVSINSDIIQYVDDKVIYATMAHEFQHLINASNTIDSLKLMGTWINESMSGFIEEKIYNGSKAADGHIDSFLDSDRIRNGQSLYNFDSGMYDIGVYGSVYFFAEYLADLAGDDIFSKIHSYWKESSTSKTADAEAIMNSVSSKVQKNIAESIEYNNEIDFDSDEEEWLSKLTLDFYISTLNSDDIAAFENIKPTMLLYDEIDSAEIEGGGRIIVAVKDNSFKIPDGADDGLIYVGLNDDFEVITEYLCK